MKAGYPEPDDHQLISNVVTSAGTLASMREALDRIARQCSDKQLTISLAPVRKALASAALQNIDDSARITLPVDQAPYSSLIAYCRRKVQ